MSRMNKNKSNQMKTLKNLFLTVLFVIGLVSTSFATKDTVIVASTTQVYDMNMNLITSVNLNSGDTLLVYNTSGITVDFICNTTTFTSICGTCSFEYKTLPTDAPSFVLKATYMSTTINLPLTVYVNNITTGISENTNKIEFEAFPNPVTENLTISANTELGKVTVTNLTGQVVFTDLVNDTKTNIDFTTFANGVYVVQVGGTTEKVIK